MIKTQVQLPDQLYYKAKAIAEQREWSLAEVVRRGIEYMALAYPVTDVSTKHPSYRLFADGSVSPIYEAATGRPSGRALELGCGLGLDEDHERLG